MGYLEFLVHFYIINTARLVKLSDLDFDPLIYHPILSYFSIKGFVINTKGKGGHLYHEGNRSHKKTVSTLEFVSHVIRKESAFLTITWCFISLKRKRIRKYI